MSTIETETSINDRPNKIDAKSSSISLAWLSAEQSDNDSFDIHPNTSPTVIRYDDDYNPTSSSSDEDTSIHGNYNLETNDLYEWGNHIAEVAFHSTDCSSVIQQNTNRYGADYVARASPKPEILVDSGNKDSIVQTLENVMDFNQDIDMAAIYSYVEDITRFYDSSVSGDGFSESHETWIVQGDSTGTNGDISTDADAESYTHMRSSDITMNIIEQHSNSNDSIVQSSGLRNIQPSQMFCPTCFDGNFDDCCHHSSVGFIELDHQQSDTVFIY